MTKSENGGSTKGTRMYANLFAPGEAMKWAGKNVSDNPDGIPTLASMLFGDDWEDEMAGLGALRRDVNYLVRNAKEKIPKFLEALNDNVNGEIKVREVRLRKRRGRQFRGQYTTTVIRYGLDRGRICGVAR